MRTDRNRNPAAFTVAMARQAGLKPGVDYEVGDPFQVDGATLYTAKLLGDPVALTIQVIDRLGFYTQHGGQRWTYIAMPPFVWDSLAGEVKRRIVGWMYGREGGSEMKGLFA